MVWPTLRRTNTTAIINEPSTGAYARAGVAASLATWAGTQAAASTVASTGTAGTTSNNAAITFPAPTANWASGSAQAVGFVEYDAATAGNLLTLGLFVTPKTINSGDPAPSFAAGVLSLQIDN